MTNPHLSIQTTAQLPEIAHVNGLLADFFKMHGLRAADMLDLRIAAEEILSNIVRHGRIVTDPDRVITVVIAVDLTLTECVMCFEDDADAANPLDAPAPDISVTLKDRRPGGLGLHLIRTLMDRVEYQRRPGWNRFTVAKRLSVVTPAQT